MFTGEGKEVLAPQLSLKPGRLSCRQAGVWLLWGSPTLPRPEYDLSLDK